MSLKNASVPDVTNVKTSRLMIWLLSLTVGLFITWASLAEVDQIVRGSGKIVPTSNTQIIQNLEGGLLSELLVTEGQIVERGEVLARLSDKRFRAAFDELEGQVLALEIKLLRLRAEIDKQTAFFIPANLQARAPEVAASEKQLFAARTADYANARAALLASLDLHAREEAILERSVSRRTAPEIDLVKARQAKQDVQSQLGSIDNEYTLKRSEEYAAALTELAQVRANLAARRDQLARTVLTAPTRGIVNKVLITTIGGVAPPGEPILELTPLDDELRIEAEIQPKDIAFIYPGMRSTIKLSAFDYTVYGSFEGEVLHVSADTFEKPNARDNAPYYKVQIALKETTLRANGTSIEVRPGMLADAELHIGKNTVIGYLLKPLFKASLAFREP